MAHVAMNFGARWQALWIVENCRLREDSGSAW